MRRIGSLVILSLFAVALFAGLSMAQQDAVQDTEADCDTPESPNDPDWYDTETSDPATGVQLNCQEDTSRKDDVPPFAPATVSYTGIGLNNFTVRWDAAHDFDTEDSTEYRPSEGDREEFDPPPESPEGGNGTIDQYILYNSTSPFTDTAGKESRTFDRVEPDATGEGGEPPATSFEFTDLESDTTQYIAITAVDAHGNEGEPIFSQFTTPLPKIVLSETAVSIEENKEHFQYNITLSGIIAEGTTVPISLEVISNNDLGIDPVEIDVTEVVLTPSRPKAFVNITFEDDDFGLGDRTDVIRHTINESDDGRDKRFDDAPDADLEFRILEDEVEPSINLAGETAIQVVEGFDDETGELNTVAFQVTLSREPTDDVFIHVATDDDARLPLASHHFLHFTRANWDEPQNVTLVAVDNDDVDGDQPVIIDLVIIDDESAQEYVDRAPDRRVVVLVIDDEVDEDGDGIPDDKDRDPDDPFNKDYRPSGFRHQVLSNGSIQFNWTARHLDDRIDFYVIWEFSDPTEATRVDVVDGQREYSAFIPFDDDAAHRYSLQAVLKAQSYGFDGGLPYNEDASVRLGTVVFSQEYFDRVCDRDDAEDEDNDKVCQAFEEEIGTDDDEKDTDGDGRTDHQELFVDGTDPADPNSHYTFVPSWGRNVWLIVGSVFVLASVIITIVSLARGSDEDDYETARS